MQPRLAVHDGAAGALSMVATLATLAYLAKPWHGEICWVPSQRTAAPPAALSGMAVASSFTVPLATPTTQKGAHADRRAAKFGLAGAAGLMAALGLVQRLAVAARRQSNRHALAAAGSRSHVGLQAVAGSAATLPAPAGMRIAG